MVADKLAANDNGNEGVIQSSSGWIKTTQVRNLAHVTPYQVYSGRRDDRFIGLDVCAQSAVLAYDVDWVVHWHPEAMWRQQSAPTTCCSSTSCCQAQGTDVLARLRTTLPTRVRTPVSSLARFGGQDDETRLDLAMEAKTRWLPHKSRDHPQAYVDIIQQMQI